MPTKPSRSRWIPITTLIAVLGLLLAACGADTPDTPGAADGADGTDEAAAPAGERPDTLVIALPEDLESMDVMNTLQSVTRMTVGTSVAEALAYWDHEADEVVPRLATDWEQTDDRVWTITLREGVTFTNGEEMTAEDAAATINYAVELTSPYYQAFIPTISGAEAVDEYTFEIHTEEPDPAIFRRLQYIRVLPADTLDEDILNDELVGTGPYQVANWDRGRGLTLERNEDYWGEQGEFDNVEFIVRPEARVRVDALLAGEAHAAMLIGAEQADDVPQLAAVPGQEVAGFVLNTVGQTGGSIMEDVRIRQAIQYAIDREAVGERIFAGRAILPQCHYNPPYMTGTDPDLEDYPYDPDRGRELVQEAGAEGETVRMRINTTRWQQSREFSEAVAGYISEIGLVPEITNTDFSQWQEAQAAHLAGEDAPYDMFILYHGNEFFDSSLKSASNLRSHDAGSGIWLIADDELDRLTQSAIESSDPEERASLMREAWGIVCEEAYMLPVTVPEFLTGLAEDLEWNPRPDELIYLEEIGWRD